MPDTDRLHRPLHTGTYIILRVFRAILYRFILKVEGAIYAILGEEANHWRSKRTFLISVI